MRNIGLITFGLLMLSQIAFRNADSIYLKASFIDTFETPQRETLNVKDFGALGNNEADDGPAIQKVLDKAAGLTGAVVFFPEGVYLVVNPGNGDSGIGKYGLRVGSNTTLILSKTTILRKKGNDEIIGNKNPEDGNKNIIITGGIFETDSGTDQKWAPSRTGILFVNVSNSQITRSSFRHVGNSGIVFGKNCADNVVSNCIFTDIFNCGIELLGQRNTARNNYLHDMGSDGILVKGDNCVVRNNRLVRIGQYSAPSLGSSISLGADNVPCKNSKVLNNTITGAAAHGIINDRSANTIIQGNAITNTGSAGIKIGGGGLKSSVRKNIIKNAGLSKTLTGVYVHSGIIVDGAEVEVSDNNIQTSTGSGIYINASATNSTVKRSKISGTKKPGNDSVESKDLVVKAANVIVENAEPTKTRKKRH